MGGGNSALEESVFLTQFVRKLYIVIRRDQFRAEEKFQREVEANDKSKSSASTFRFKCCPMAK